MAEGMTILISLSALVVAWVVFKQLIKTAITLVLLVGFAYLVYENWATLAPHVTPLFESLQGAID